MKIKRFNEAATEKHENVNLYRLSAYPVIDLSEPGDYYVTSKSALDSKLLKSKGKKGDLYVINVKTNSNNIDLDKSDVERAKFNNNKIVVVKDDKKCELIKVEPFKD